MVLFAVGEALEGFTLDRARAALRSLMNTAPAEAVVLRRCIDCAEHLGMPLPDAADGTGAKYVGGPCPFCGWHETTLPVAAVRVGDRVLGKPGERSPVDGVVRAGSAWVDEATITGESTPVTKSVGEAVYAGTLDTDGVLEVDATQAAGDTVVQRIVRLVEESQSRRASTERFVDRFARVYTPAVTAAALVTAIVPPLAFGAPFWGEQGWAYRALELLVVACPCALVVATPAAVVSAIAAAARSGVLVKGGAAIESLARVRAVAFDKTGTLTTGRLRVIEVRGAACAHAADASCASCDELLALACAVERRSAHPAARAIVAEAERRGVLSRYAAADDVETAPGRGVRGMVRGQRVSVGSPAFVGVSSSAPCAGASVASVSVDGAYLGDVVMSDELRPEATAAVQALRRTGVTHIAMLTGDAPAAADLIARRVGVDVVHAGLLPAQKNERIEAMRAAHGAVAMVGDGVNDAPALAVSDVGIAMGAKGSTAASESADVVILLDDIARVARAVAIGRRTVRIALQSIWLGIVISVGLMLVAAVGLLPAVVGATLQEAVDLIAILGALRAVRAGVAPVPGLDAAPRSSRTTTGPVPDAEASLGTGPAGPPVDR